MKHLLKYWSIVLFISVIIAFVLAYVYLKKIESCDCLIQKDEKEKLDIRRLEYVILVILAIIIVDHYVILNDHIDRLGVFRFVLIAIVIYLYGYFIYVIYYFSKNIKNPECKCGRSWERFFLYKQFLLYIFVFTVIIFAILFGIEHELLDEIYKSTYMRNIVYLFRSSFK